MQITGRDVTCSKPGWIARRAYAFALPLCLLLASCATVPVGQADNSAEPAPVATQPPPTEVYFYPKQGQSPQQQDRDRYECYLWASKKTGFEPSQAGMAPHQQVRVVPQAAPGRDTAMGAVTGAVVGAAVSGPDDRVGGAVIGAIAGATLGAVSDASRQQQAERIRQSYNQADEKQQARLDQQASNYRRAMAACLEGRGYAVHE